LCVPFSGGPCAGVPPISLPSVSPTTSLLTPLELRSLRLGKIQERGSILSLHRYARHYLLSCRVELSEWTFSLTCAGCPPSMTSPSGSTVATQWYACSCSPDAISLISLQMSGFASYFQHVPPWLQRCVSRMSPMIALCADCFTAAPEPRSRRRELHGLQPQPILCHRRLGGLPA
jgi:hypothetical protein